MKDKIIIISIMTYYAQQIFKGDKKYEFRKSPIKNDLLNKNIYVYSAKNDKAIIGTFKVKKVLCGNTQEILKLTGYDKRKDKDEIISYFGTHNPKCYALELYDIKLLNKSITLNEMRKKDKFVNMPQYIKYINNSNPLYELIKNAK